MALKQCKACSTEISVKAAVCPKCGHPNDQAKHLSGGSVLGIFLLAGIAVWWIFGGGLTKTAAIQMDDIHNQVASDAVAQYEIAKRQGDPMQICVNAGLVTASYLQAKDESKYRAWKKTEKVACQNAGVPDFE